MHVSALYRYPVKSLGGERLTEIMAAERGFKDDRRWMLVDTIGQFISQRKHPHLTKLSASLAGERGLRIHHSDDPSTGLTLSDARPAGAGDVTVTVWDDTFSACLVSAPGLSDLVGIPDVRLVYMNDRVSRPVDPRYAAGEEVSFADGYPYLITTTASFRSLSERLGQEVDVLRFRPNIVIDTSEAFAEDRWSRIRIGQLRFRLPKPCARCIMVTVNPGEGGKDLTVLSTLAAYRKQGNKTYFGMNAILEDGPGFLRVNDPVEVLLAGQPE
ncbi:MOSC domain-containing protein [Lewinella sp. IMCC34191]|uniref:MOSC domain-containing protein n=1 Tax=Lewinella sp. IMCC34191 TaxID=2259172 RepID=UPI000E259C72|nr:MOSC N-terminal beta barrel domain-containing protein [Lewinella sp. IMCC34191]